MHDLLGMSMHGASSVAVAEEELEHSPLLDLHQVCQAAHVGKTATDKQTVSEWGSFQDKLQSLANEVHNAAPADLFPNSQEQTPPAELQQQYETAVAEYADAVKAQLPGEGMTCQLKRCKSLKRDVETSASAAVHGILEVNKPSKTFSKRNLELLHPPTLLLVSHIPEVV